MKRSVEKVLSKTAQQRTSLGLSDESENLHWCWTLRASWSMRQASHQLKEEP
jgi:hypothetical protein